VKRSRMAEIASAVMAATSFGAIAEMAGGADKTDIHIKLSVIGFAICMAGVSWAYIYIFR
jgi:hypothetical protein